MRTSDLKQTFKTLAGILVLVTDVDCLNPMHSYTEAHPTDFDGLNLKVNEHSIES